MFISFAPPKEMNQRKGGRKCQLQSKRAPATQAIKALPFCLKFTPFPVCPRSSIYQIMQHHDNFGISNGLREFWDKAIFFRLAAQAIGKQYCLSDAERSRGRASCIAWASVKTIAPKFSAALNFLWLLSLFQDKERNKGFYYLCRNFYSNNFI